MRSGVLARALGSQLEQDRTGPESDSTNIDVPPAAVIGLGEANPLFDEEASWAVQSHMRRITM